MGSGALGEAILIAVLAAGASSRMGGRDKLLEPVGGAPLLRVVTERAIATDCPVCVTLPASGARWPALDGLAVERLVVPDAGDGMSASFRAIAGAARGRAVMACLADMPEIETTDMLALIAASRARPERVVRATDGDGRPGQPVLFPARLVPCFARLSGDRGARDILAGETVHGIALPGQRALVDLDTPADWSAWRARTGIER